MIDEKNQESGVAEDAFDLQIEAEPDTEEIMREAVEAVESHLRDEEIEEHQLSKQRREDQLTQKSDGQGQDSDSQPSAAQLQDSLKEAQERAVRALADYENFRRRVERERADHARYAAEAALSEFLPILDNLGRALQADGDLQDLKSGVELTYKQMLELLERFNVIPVASVGERFDPAVHEAVAREEAHAVEQPTVLEEYQTGYQLHDRLLRPSMVRVALPKDDVAPAEGAASETGKDDTAQAK